MIAVSGKVASRSRAGVGGLRVEIVDKNVGPDVRVAEVTTDDHGAYRATFEVRDLDRRGKQRPDLQARVFAGKQFLGASEVRYDASDRETLNVVLAASADAQLPSEHETLTSAVAARFRGNLRDLQETDERQDITYLANKTGWDARAVAMAALADQFSSQSADASGRPAIAPPFFYALFRAGLPANETGLYRTSPKTVGAIWSAAIEQGVIPAALAKEVPRVLAVFEHVAASRALDAPPLAGPSTLKEMLTVSLGADPARHRQFAEIHTKHGSSPTEMWTAIRSTFGETVERRLRVDGQLGYLTINNAPLVRKLHAATGADGLTDVRHLPTRGFYRASAWVPLIGTDKIPPEIPGRDAEEKRNRYAELLAAQVRLSFPTAVVAEMIDRGETPIAEGVRSQVHAFLSAHEAKFELGAQPVEQYLARNAIALSPAATQEIKRVQRVYQITPSDDAMNTLLKKGVDSALAIARLERDQFVRAFKEDLGGETEARLVHARSQQVHNAALNIAFSYLIARTAPAIGVHSPAQITDQAPKGSAANAGDVIAYATLETLFGEMDYCDCDHCRSILSPAAYLVDLLGFCDQAPNSSAKFNPQQVLFERRPDIQHLPLTCENTNTPVPYIDLVNETLEYFVAPLGSKGGLSLAKYEGHSTDGTSTPEEILATPENASSVASAEAYDVLKGTLFPPPMPFHQSLEAVRLHFDKFELRLPEVMEALRKNDDLERSSPEDYGWRDILMEELRLSRAEHALLTDGGLTLQQLYGFPLDMPDHDVLFGVSDDGDPNDGEPFGLAFPKAFSRRIGISYENVVELLRTRFINPNSTLIPQLQRLGVPFTTLKQLKDTPPGTAFDAQFDALLSPGLDPAEYDGDVKKWVRDPENYARIMSLIILVNIGDPDDNCTFEALQFRYSDPDAQNEIRPFEFVRMLRFIRLWKKLGWTIEQTDKAITALYPADQTPDAADDVVNLQRLDAGFLTLLPRLGVVKRVMAALKLKPAKDLLALLACFAPIDTHGAASLYRSMFLSSAIAKQDAALADDGFGNVLKNANEPLRNHTAALRGAFLLTEDELDQITTSLGFGADTPLNLDNVSAVFRRGWLAKKLKLSVREMLLLTEFTGLDPFAAPDPPNPPILRFIELVQRLRAASFKPDHALYLVWNQDVSGKSAPDQNDVLALARTLRASFAAVESEFALVDDPEGQIARARMALVYGHETTDLFFGLLENTISVEAHYSHPQPKLESAILAVAPGRLAYDDFRKRLAFAGALTGDIRDALQSIAGVTAEFQAAVDTLFAESEKITSPFFGRYPELRDLYNAYVASSDPVETKRTVLLASFLPELSRRRKRQQAIQVASAAAGVDAVLGSAVLEDPAVLQAAISTDPPEASTDLAAVGDLTILETPGLSAQIFFADSADGTHDDVLPAEAILDYAVAGPQPLPLNGNDPDEPISGIWSGYVEAPENGFFNLRIEADAGSTVLVTLDDENLALTPNADGSLWTNDDEIELRSGTLYRFTLRVDRVKSTLRVSWQTFGRGSELIPSRLLYSDTRIGRLGTTYVRVLKSASLAGALKLTAREFAHLAADSAQLIDGQGWLNSLPTEGSPNAATATALLGVLRALLDFARIKADLSPRDERLLDVVEDLAAVTSDSAAALLALTRWNPDSLSALLERFSSVTADLARVDTFARIYDAYALLNKLKVPAAALLKAATNDPNAATVGELQAALRARYDEAAWFGVLKPINDQMRSLQRDALVAHILHQFGQSEDSRHIDSPDKLFEYFLMDVEMEPCMQTSRVRHALSSVQLFIERCLMNLEPRVSPSSLSAPRWEWMKRYRVWEANRKVFLFPENWLEPELRDDQSPFFKEAMSELLQKDITEDAAATALLNYLSKLEEVAKLEPCGIHYVESDVNHANPVAHVIARTAGANRKYFYRRREGISWTPWEQIQLDIEDNPVIPVVWRERLFVFWLKILKQAPLNVPEIPAANADEIHPSEIIGDNPVQVTVQAVLNWSEYFNGKWQPTKTSSVDAPAELGSFDPTGAEAFNRAKLDFLVYEDGGALVLTTGGEGSAGWFVLFNTHSLPDTTTKSIPDEIQESATILASTETDTLVIQYSKGDVTLHSPKLLKNPIPHRAVTPHNHLSNGWDAPFFYEDRRHVFYVTTELHLARDGYGVTVAPDKPERAAPNLVFPEVQVIPDKFGPVAAGSHVDVANPGPMQRFVSEDARIEKAIGAVGTVKFGNKNVGPSGSVTKSIQAK